MPSIADKPYSVHADWSLQPGSVGQGLREWEKATLVKIDLICSQNQTGFKIKHTMLSQTSSSCITILAMAVLSKLHMMHILIIANARSSSVTRLSVEWRKSFWENNSLRLWKPWQTSKKMKFTTHSAWQYECYLSSHCWSLWHFTDCCLATTIFSHIFTTRSDVSSCPCTWEKPPQQHCSASCSQRKKPSDVQRAQSHKKP